LIELFVEPEGFFARTAQARSRSRESSNPLFRVLKTTSSA